MPQETGACYPSFAFDERFVISREVLEKVNPLYLRANRWVPLWRADGVVHVLVADPNQLEVLDDIRQVYSGSEIQFYAGPDKDVERFIDSISLPARAAAAKSIEELLAAPGDEVALESAHGEVDLSADDSAVVRLAHQIIADAWREGASDVHIEPYPDREAIIRFRVDGECSIYRKVPSRFRRALASRLKIMGGLDIAERRKPQDGKISCRLGERSIELRIATVPTARDIEDVVLRLLAAREPIPLEKLDLSAQNLKDVISLLDLPHGLILCAGPTGSGKTTSLHSMLWYLNGPHRKIWTAEDPVEITQYGLRQVQVQPKAGLTFAVAMRSFLRADPDVIMVGEMRDKETAEIAVQASLTGHLVLSTLHTNGALETVSRLLDMGLDAFNFADSLKGVLAQRLVRRVCADCRESYRPSGQLMDEISRHFGEEAFAGLAFKLDNLQLWRGRGCGVCRGSGYRGRMGIHELLVVDGEISKLIQGGADPSQLLACAAGKGMKPLLRDGLLKCLAGDIDFNDLKAAASAGRREPVKPPVSIMNITEEGILESLKRG